jgi:hypothetical protein
MKLSGEAFEEALSKLTETQRNAFEKYQFRGQ